MFFFLLLYPSSVTMGQRKEGEKDVNEVKCDIKRRREGETGTNKPNLAAFTHSARLLRSATQSGTFGPILYPQCSSVAPNSCFI